jgi:hypothetical protein
MKLSVEPLVARLVKSRSFVLGAGIVGQCDLVTRHQLLAALGDACAHALQRRVLVIRMGTAAEWSAAYESQEQCKPDELRWREVGDSSADKQLWNQQLAHWTRIRIDYGLVVMDVGQLSHSKPSRSLGLCDGIVLHMLESPPERHTIKSLKALRAGGPPILGAWSVALHQRAAAA